MQSLEGIRVLDLTQHLSGPYCTMILGDLGAEILKIEKLEGGDDKRQLGPFVNGESAPFMSINRNKKSIALNLKSDEGRKICLDLARASDVVIENFRPGVARSLGIDHAAVEAVNPGIVYCSISGYGQTGPASRKGGFDIMAQGMTGLMDLNSSAGERPSKIPISLHDLGAGLVGLYAILAACIHKLKTGAGQYIDVSLVEAGLALTAQESAAYFTDGTVPKVGGTRNHLSAPYQAYKARDACLIIGAGNQSLWKKLCSQVIERPAWIDDPRFATASERIRHADELESMLEEVLAEKDAAHWIARLDEAGVPGGPINTLDQALNDSHMRARDMVLEFDHPRAGRTRTLGMPAKLSRTPGAITRPPPLLGQHTQEVLESVLSLTPAEIDTLRRNHAIA